MFKFSFRKAGFIAFAAISFSAASAAGETPKPTEILFGRPHIASVAPGTELVYKFERKPSDPKVLGEGFTDDIKVKVESDGAPGKKKCSSADLFGRPGPRTAADH